MVPVVMSGDVLPQKGGCDAQEFQSGNITGMLKTLQDQFVTVRGFGLHTWKLVATRVSEKILRI